MGELSTYLAEVIFFLQFERGKLKILWDRLDLLFSFCLLSDLILINEP